ncbi:hypothetical protein VTG60DRAFT_6395 [Thermothelomyces hinnuleus]
MLEEASPIVTSYNLLQTQLAAAGLGGWMVHQLAFVRSFDCGPTKVDSMPSPPPHNPRRPDLNFPSSELGCFNDCARGSGSVSADTEMLGRSVEAPRPKSKTVMMCGPLPPRRLQHLQNEKILSRQLRDGPGSAVPESQPNDIDQNNPDARRHRMTQLIQAGLNKIDREAKSRPYPKLRSPGVAFPSLYRCCQPYNRDRANRKGIDYVVQKMNWYWSLPSSLLKDLSHHASELSEERRELETELVNLYKLLLLYQTKSVCSYYRSRGLVLLRDIIKLDDWDADLKAIRDAEHHARNQEMQQLSEKDQKCLKHLRLADPRDDKARIEQTKGGLLADLYRRVPDDPEFQPWRYRLESSLLWIKGGPGKGKTMLLCGIINELEQAIVNSGQNIYNLAYFFCQATDSQKYDDAGKSLFQDANAWVALSDIFGRMLGSRDLKPTYLIIDALDECVADLPNLLGFINRVSSDRVRWLLSSRNEPEIERKLRCDERQRLSLELKENAEQVSRAADVFIDHKLSKLERLQTDTLLEVRDILHKKANGTFLWVALVVQELSKEEVASWHVPYIVEELPSDLNGMYKRMLDNIGRRGLSGLPEEILKPTENVKSIVAKCGSFLTIQDDRVYLIHQSAKDYLSTGRTSTLLFPCGVATAHRDILTRSLQLMPDKLHRDMYDLGAPGFPIEDVQVPDPEPPSDGTVLVHLLG